MLYFLNKGNFIHQLFNSDYCGIVIFSVLYTDTKVLLTKPWFSVTLLNMQGFFTLICTEVWQVFVTYLYCNLSKTITVNTKSLEQNNHFQHW